MSPAPLAPQSFQEVPVNSVRGVGGRVCVCGGFGGLGRGKIGRPRENGAMNRGVGTLGSVYLCPSLYLGVQCVVRMKVRVHACKCVSGWHVTYSCSVNSHSVSFSLAC